jgi:hypothetical protein
MLTLIQRDECALCDEAWEILHQAGVRDFESVYIDGDAGLEAVYGTRVPVLRQGAVELDWPFDAERVRRWLV